MTREEAIKELEILKEDYWDDDGYGHETKQYDDTMLALDMAIKALEQDSTTKNDLGVDYISRADVNRIICEYRDDATETGNERDLERAYGANAVGELISELPSVTPQELRKGHWIADVDKWGDVVTTVNGYRCDKCNTFNADKDNFCPNCGADMREVEE